MQHTRPPSQGMISQQCYSKFDVFLFIRNAQHLCIRAHLKQEIAQRFRITIKLVGQVQFDPWCRKSSIRSRSSWLRCRLSRLLLCSYKCVPTTHQFIQYIQKLLRCTQAWNTMMHEIIELLIGELSRISSGKCYHLSLTYLYKSWLSVVKLIRFPQRSSFKTLETSCEILDI